MPNHSSLYANDPEGIEAIIDYVAADSKKAAYAKALLRNKASTPKTILPFPAAIDAANDDEDMWDNMPV